MKLNIKTFAIISVLSFSLLNCFSKETDRIYNFARQLELNNADNQAALEYKRFIFFSEESDTDTLHALSFLRDFYSRKGDLFNSQKYARLASQTAGQIDSKLKDETYIKEIDIISQDNSKINLQPQILTYTFDNYSLKVNKAAWCSLISTNLRLQNFDEAKDFYQTAKVKMIFSDDEMRIIESSFDELFKCSPKNPKLALFLSFIPGLGQCYAHNFKDGVNAFILNGSLIGLSSWSICTGNYLDFIYFEFSPLFRFYRGNLYNAQKETFDYNDRLFEKKYENILKICDSSY